MAASDSLLERVCATCEGYLALGNRWAETPHACFVSNPRMPSIYDANHGCRVRAATPEAIDAVLQEAETRFAGLGHRQFRVDPCTPPAFEARLALEDFVPELELELVLEGPLLAEPRTLALRPAQGDADWAAVERLTLLDHDEEAARQGREPYGEAVTRQMVALRRAKADGGALATWIAREEGVDCAFLSSWPGHGGVGKVEDLFTHPAFRRRGIALALLAHGVADCRRRGAETVLIGARPDDTPKRLYQALGFRPFCLNRSWLKRIPASRG